MNRKWKIMNREEEVHEGCPEKFSEFTHFMRTSLK
jgi:hypothetical protein